MFFRFCLCCYVCCFCFFLCFWFSILFSLPLEPRDSPPPSIITQAPGHLPGASWNLPGTFLYTGGICTSLRSGPGQLSLFSVFCQLIAVVSSRLFSCFTCLCYFMCVPLCYSGLFISMFMFSCCVFYVFNENICKRPSGPPSWNLPETFRFRIILISLD